MMVNGYLGLLLIVKFFTICWMFDFIPTKSMFRKQLETTMSVGIVTSLILFFILIQDAGFLKTLTSMYIVLVMFITEAMLMRSIPFFKLIVQYKTLGLVDHRFEELPILIKDDILTLMLVFYNVLYVAVVAIVLLLA